MSASNLSTSTGRPNAFSCRTNHVAAPRAPTEPGVRSGYVSASCVAAARAACSSNAGGSAGAASTGGRVTLNAATSSGTPTSSHVPR